MVLPERRGGAPESGHFNTRGQIDYYLLTGDRKVLESAIANAENNEGADIDELKVSEIYVNEGMTMKRIKPRAKGRADRIFKRSSHITVTVTDE